MTAEFVDLVRRLRTSQKLYFKTRDENELVRAKQLERDVDKALAEIAKGPPKPDLFSQE